jgi:hypothetical protein
MTFWTIGRRSILFAGAICLDSRGGIVALFGIQEG